MSKRTLRPTRELLRAALTDQVELPTLGHVVDTSHAKPAAVIVPITFAPELAAICVLRGAELHDHPGEVGFPGGKPEAADTDLVATALRELAEEVGVAPSEVTIAGALRPVPVITGRYLIHPFVGVLAEGARPKPLTSEIARVISIPLLPLVTGERRMHAFRGSWNGIEVYSPHVELDRCILYGASAFILYELLLRLAAALGVVLPAPIEVAESPWGSRYRP